MMSELEVIKELDQFVLERSTISFEIDAEFIKMKLVELRDNLIEWMKIIEHKKGVQLLGKTSIISDIAGIILDKKSNLYLIDSYLFNRHSLPLTIYDKIIIYCYVNWKISENNLVALGYNLPCPYTPYFDLFKSGSSFLQYDHNFLSISHIGIWVFPQ